MKVGILYVKGGAFGVVLHLVSDYVNDYLTNFRPYYFFIHNMVNEAVILATIINSKVQLKYNYCISIKQHNINYNIITSRKQNHFKNYNLIKI